MTTKEAVLKELEKSSKPHSGGQMALKLSISRAAVWKAIQSLREDGYEISSASGRGYKLEVEPNLLSKSRISSLLEGTAMAFDITLLEEVDSSNTYLRQMARKGVPQGSVVIAKRQTAGRGRFKRSFYSPAGSGIYMSLLLRPNLPPQDCTTITVAAAVCVARAIHRVCGIKVDFKWVNDLMLCDKKLCGILTEAMVQMESGLVEYVVVGIGINVERVDTGEDTHLGSIITSLAEHTDTPPLKNQLIAEILREIDRYYSDPRQNFVELLRQYKENFWLMDKWVSVSTDREPVPYLVRGVDEGANLLLESQDGQERILQSGEVSVRAIENR